MPDELILASKSPHRIAMLEAAGLSFKAQSAGIDERAVEAPLAGADASPADVAQVLAEAKALDVAGRHPGHLVIGADQTLEIEGEMLHKPADMEAARRHLLRLSGRTHHLHAAVVVVRGEETLWRHVSTVAMTMRDLDPGFIGRHLALVGDRALTSVGAYQVEGPGIQLFEKIDGDYFAIVGLPLLPLLKTLRDLGGIDG